MIFMSPDGVVDLHYCRCRKCGGDLSTAFVSLSTHMNRFVHDLFAGNYEVCCDHCGYVATAAEYREVRDDDQGTDSRSSS